MKKDIFISGDNIIIEKNEYQNSDYSLYNLKGTLLQKGVIDVNGIPINPNLKTQTLVIVLMKHSSIFSQKLHFT
jgi:hypothetical protein